MESAYDFESESHWAQSEWDFVCCQHHQGNHQISYSWSKNVRHVILVNMLTVVTHGHTNESIPQKLILSTEAQQFHQ
jgi:hypothetical protein